MPPPKRFNPRPEELEVLYGKMTMKELAAHYGVGETVIHKRIHEAGIEPKRHGDRRGRGFTQEHRKNMSKARAGKARPHLRTGFYGTCKQCGTKMWVIRARTDSQRYCSDVCRHLGHRKEFQSKVCPECNSIFSRREDQTSTAFEKQVFCSTRCSQQANPPPTLIGEDNPKWKGDGARRKQSRSGQSAWRKAVLKSDNYTCQGCGVIGENVLLVAHHIKPFEDYPELRYDVDNGKTLCEPCHFEAHDYDTSNKEVVELRDERGVLMRRVFTNCAWCGKPIVKQASDMKRSDGSLKPNVYCGYSCAGKGNKRRPKL